MKVYTINYSAKTYDTSFLPPFNVETKNTNMVLSYFLDRCRSDSVTSIVINEICDLDKTIKINR